MPDGVSPARHGTPDRPVGPDRTVALDRTGVPDDVTAGRVSCTGCGTTAPARPITWTLQVDDGGTTWLCDVCTRRDLRSIESRLDETWW